MAVSDVPPGVFLFSRFRLVRLRDHENPSCSRKPAEPRRYPSTPPPPLRLTPFRGTKGGLKQHPTPLGGGEVDKERRGHDRDRFVKLNLILRWSPSALGFGVDPLLVAAGFFPRVSVVSCTPFDCRRSRLRRFMTPNPLDQTNGKPSHPGMDEARRGWSPTPPLGNLVQEPDHLLRSTPTEAESRTCICDHVACASLSKGGVALAQAWSIIKKASGDASRPVVSSISPSAASARGTSRLRQCARTNPRNIRVSVSSTVAEADCSWDPDEGSSFTLGSAFRSNDSTTWETVHRQAHVFVVEHDPNDRTPGPCSLVARSSRSRYRAIRVDPAKVVPIQASSAP